MSLRHAASQNKLVPLLTCLNHVLVDHGIDIGACDRHGNVALPRHLLCTSGPLWLSHRLAACSSEMPVCS